MTRDSKPKINKPTHLRLVTPWPDRCEELEPFPDDDGSIEVEIVGSDGGDDYEDLEDEELDKAIQDLEAAHRRWCAAKGKRRVLKWDRKSKKLV